MQQLGGRSGTCWLGIDGVCKEEEDLPCILGTTVLFPSWALVFRDKTLPLVQEPMLSGLVWGESPLQLADQYKCEEKGIISLDTPNAVSKLTIPRNGPGPIKSESLKLKFFLNISTFVPGFLCMIFKKIYLFFGCIGFSVRCMGFLQLWRAGAALCCSALASHYGGFSCGGERALECTGFSCCGTWAPQLWLAGSRAQAQQLWCTDLVAPQHVRSSRTRTRTLVCCIGRWILNHCATREVPIFFFNQCQSSLYYLPLGLNFCTPLPLQNDKYSSIFFFYYFYDFMFYIQSFQPSGIYSNISHDLEL